MSGLSGLANKSADRRAGDKGRCPPAAKGGMASQRRPADSLAQARVKP